MRTTASQLLILTALVMLGAPGRPAWSATILFDDPLTDGQSGATISGGQFVSEGWKSTNNADQLYYKLPDGMLEGYAEFEAKGFQIGTGVDRQHIWGVYDVFRDKYLVDDNSCGCNGFTLRIYHQQIKAHPPGGTRFRLNGNLYSKKQADTNDLGWDSSTWYRFRFSWTQTKASWERNGKQIGTFNYPDENAAFVYLYINNDNHGGFKGLKNIVYRNVVISTDDPNVSDGLPNQPPLASLNASYTSGFVGEALAFDGSGSIDRDGNITAHVWDFGDGSSAGDATVSHFWDAPGIYTVKLTVTDDDGDQDSQTVQVTISVPDTTPPTIGLAGLAFAAGLDDLSISEVTVDGTKIPVAAAGLFGGDVALAGGPQSIQISAADAAGNTSLRTMQVVF